MFDMPQLIQTLEGLTPLELSGVKLLQTLRPQTGEWFPTTLSPESKGEVISATVELVAYTRRCADMGRRLAQLQPIPLRGISLAEFGL